MLTNCPGCHEIKQMRYRNGKSLCESCWVTEDERVLMSFLEESNAIEGVYSQEALEDARKAWDYAVTQDEMSLQMILKVHRILMSRLNPRIAGKLRDVNVMVGGRVCPSPEESKERLNKWVIVTNDILVADDYINPDGIAIESHIDFEKIHPFEDGNGRVGRILWNWLRLKMWLPVQVIKEWERHDYYKLFHD